uniref:Uncharacterized protein n=1 Tax=Zooxanthella nutricula TaxID=1333877 RepID=A0A7S2M7Y1_9DINO
MNPHRKTDFSELMRDFHGGSDHLFIPSMKRSVKPVIGLVRTLCKRSVRPPRLFRVDSEWLARQKADAPMCSTNDILTSVLLKTSRAHYGIMPVNLRDRIPGIECSDVGNYWRPQEILVDEFQTPPGVRGVVSAATAVARDSIEQKRDSRRPKLAQVGRIGVVTNWAGFYRQLDLPGCKELVHMPLLHGGQMSHSHFVIFRPAKDEIAVWCAVRDTRVMAGLENVPMFASSVGRIA